MKPGLALAAAGLCAAILTGCGSTPGSQSAPAAPAEKVLTVGTDPNYPPFEFYQRATSSYTGFDTELIRSLAQELGYDRVEFVSESVPNLLAGLNAHRYDAVISCLSITDNRKAEAAFTRPYLHSGYVVVTADGIDVESLADLKTMRLAACIDTVPGELARELSDHVELCASLDSALLRVESGAADALIDDYYVLAYYFANGLAHGVTLHEDLTVAGDADLGIAVRKDDAALLDELNQGLGAFLGTTSFEQLRRSYFGDFSLSF